MEQRRGVNKFDHGGQHMTTMICVGTMGPGEQENQDWPQSFATTRHDVVGNRPHEGDLGVQSFTDHLIDGCQVFCDRGKQIGGVGGCCFGVSQGGLQSGRSEAE